MKFTKVLIDNGSIINIMYRDTMHKLGIAENMVVSIKTTFHDIVPGISCSPMGQVRVDVLFGSRQNCRVENIEFEVVDLDSPYHDLLGRPALAKFMASDHVAYLKLKMPGPSGVITISGNYKRSMDCASAGSNLAQSLVIAEEKKKIHDVAQLAKQAIMMKVPEVANPHGSVAFQAPNETKQIQLDPSFPERTATIGSNLDPK